MFRIGLCLLLTLALASGVHAQPSPPPPPAQPPPVVVPPPPSIPPAPPSIPYSAGDPELEPQITIIQRETETVEEVRVGGQLRYVKVTPRIGLPYFLVPNGNGQTFIRRDSLDTGLSTPMWLLFSW
jgi:hypothetical protein